MSNHKDNNRAFPNPTNPSQPGMTLLDYFAAMALAGWCAMPAPDSGEMVPMTQWDHEGVAKGAYDLAAAMLEERKNRSTR